MSYVPMDGEKVCRKCGLRKSVLEFRVFRVYGNKYREYRRSWCKDCEREYSREWRKKNPGYHAKWSRNYREMRTDE